MDIFYVFRDDTQFVHAHTLLGRGMNVLPASSASYNDHSQHPSLFSTFRFPLSPHHRPLLLPCFN
jgi:hypothetical protein